MILELNKEGRLVLIGASPEAAEYIEGERQRHASQTWCLSKRDYDGIFYVTSQLYEDKSQALKMVEALQNKYGLEITKSAQQIVAAWRAGLHYLEWEKNQADREEALRRRLDGLKQVLKNGCKACAYFAHDGDYGRCKANGGVLSETQLCFTHGCVDKNGVLHVGQKFYPHEGCRFLTEELA